MRYISFIVAILICSCKTIAVSSTIKDEISSYNLEGIDTLVDIGCGDGVHNKTIAHHYPNLFLVLEDLPYDLQNHNIKERITSYLKNSSYTPLIENHYRFILGTDQNIPLTTSTYKRVLCRKTLHEFSNKEKMTKELERILSNDGILIIVEAEPLYKGQLDPFCKKPLLQKDDIVNSFPSLKLQETHSVKYKNGNLVIYKFIK